MEFETINETDVLKPSEKSLSDVRGLKKDLIQEIFEDFKAGKFSGKLIPFDVLLKSVKIGTAYHNENTAEYHIKRAFQICALNDVEIETNGLNSVEITALIQKHLNPKTIGAYNEQLRTGEKKRLFRIDFKNLYR